MSDISVKKEIERRTVGFDVGANYEMGTKGGDSAVGASVNAGYQLMQVRKPGDIGFNMGLAFGIHSIARSFSYPVQAGPEYTPDDCDDIFTCEEGVNYTTVNSDAPSRFEWRDLSLRMMFAPELEVGIARLGPGLLTFGAGPQVGAELLKYNGPDASVHDKETSAVLLVSSGLRYRMERGIDVFAGARVDLADDVHGFTSMTDRMVAAAIGIGYTF